MLIAGLFILAIFTGFKYISGRHTSIRKQGLVFFHFGYFSDCHVIGLIYLNRAIETPTIHFGLAGSTLIGVMALILIIAESIWAKTWILIIIPALFALPEVILNHTTMQENTQTPLSSFISPGGIAIFLFISLRMSKD